MPFLAPFVTALTTAAAAIKSIGFFGWLAQAGVLQGIVKAGFSMAANYVLGQMFGQQKPMAQASQLQTRYGDNMARKAILGRCGDAGHHIFRNASGKGNRTVVDVYRLSDFRVSEIPRFRGQGQWRTIGGNAGQMPGINGYVYVQKRLGTMDQTAASLAVNNGGGRWTSDARGAGIAHCAVLTQLDREKMTQPWDPFFEVIGPYLYDWRKDSSVGGDGDDRWNDQDSWSGRRDNPVLQMYALERGLYNGTELMVGRGSPASDLPLAEWTVAVNICDEGGALTPRYSSSIIAEAGEGVTHEANMRPLLEACAASWIEGPSGRYPIVGAVQAVVATFTDEDVDFGEPFRWTAKRPRDQLVNTAAGSYTDPNSFYERAPLATRVETGARAVDGERLAVSLPFPAVTKPDQADELCDIALRANRYQANADICLKPKWLRIQAGRWVRWNSAKYGDRTYLVMQKRLGAFGTANVRKVYPALQEVGSGIFDATGYETVPTSPAPPGTPDYQSELDNFNVLPWVLTSEAVGERPAIKLTYDAIEDVTITHVEFEYWPSAQEEEVQRDSALADFTVKYLAVGIISNTEYKVRYRLRSDPQRDIPWVGPLTVTTPAADTTDIAVQMARLSEGARQTIQEVIARLNLSDARMEQIAMNGAEVAGSVSWESAVSRRFRDALAIALLSKKATISETAAGLRALAELSASVAAQVGPSGASGLFRISAEATPEDAEARIGLSVAATANGETKTAAILLDAMASGDSRIILAADRTMIVNGEGEVVALFDEDGVTLANALIRDLETVNIKTRSIEGDRVVQYGIDTYELQLDSVTYVDSANTSTPTNIDSGVPTSIRQMVLVDDYVSGGVMGAITVNVDLVAAFGTNNHQLLVVRDSVPTFNSSPTVVAGNVLQVDSTMSGTWYWGTAFSDIPPGPGDWYYCIKVGALFGSANSLNSQSITVSHAKR
ncbi:MAG: hypothetical protein KF810_02965 [Rhizobiaceae bacterium]|nr:hypothetical protein [Rhizobiaceae bacterium]